MRLTIEIAMDNAAFEFPSGCEVSRILRDLAGELSDRDVLPGECYFLRDVNGNKVGQAKAYGKKGGFHD